MMTTASGKNGDMTLKADVTVLLRSLKALKAVDPLRLGATNQGVFFIYT